jgi:hypothetical protein
MTAVYEQISENLQAGGVAQGSNFWNLYSVGVGSDDPYQITLADTTTMNVIAAHVRVHSTRSVWLATMAFRRSFLGFCTAASVLLHGSDRAMAPPGGMRESG